MIAFWPAWDTESKVELARAAHEAAGDSDDPLFDHVLGFELAREGSVLESTPLLAAVERAIANDPVRRGDPRALLLAADCAWWRSDLRETCVLYVEAIARARELGLAALVAQTLADFASVQIDVGAWDEAAAGLSEARRLGEDTGQLTTVCLALCRQAEIAARRGEGDEFEELNAAAARYAGTATPTDAMERNSRCLLALGTGQPDVAIASREHRESYAIEQISANALDLVEAYIRAGRSTRRAHVSTRSKRMFTSTSRVARIRAAARSWPTLRAATTSSQSHCGCSIDWAMCSRARGRGSATESGSAGRTGGETHAASSPPPLTPSSSCAPPRGPTGRGASSARAASTAGVRIPGHVMSSLRRSGRSQRSRRRARTKREIGALLFLSSRTIETHLGRVFKKLGITDRRALPTKRSPERLSETR